MRLKLEPIISDKGKKKKYKNLFELEVFVTKNLLEVVTKSTK